jgi:glycosyltransferase involved in cell wall biosynthesis
MEKTSISVLVPVKNEAANLSACLATVAFCDEVVVVDSASIDGTPDIARRAGATLVDFKWDGGLQKKKNWALSNFPWKHEWVFVLDADERITSALADELRTEVVAPRFDGYYVNRRFWFMDGWLNHCGYYPSWNLRFFRHRLGRYEALTNAGMRGTGDNEVHEHVHLQGQVGYLRAEMQHYAFPDIASWVEKHNRYSTWEAHLQYKARHHRDQGRERDLDPGLRWKRRLRRLAWRLPFRPALRFSYHYFWCAGFLDGYRGYVFCRLMAYYEFLNAAKVSELRRTLS